MGPRDIENGTRTDVPTGPRDIENGARTDVPMGPRDIENGARLDVSMGPRQLENGTRSDLPMGPRDIENGARTAPGWTCPCSFHERKQNAPLWQCGSLSLWMSFFSFPTTSMRPIFPFFY